MSASRPTLATDSQTKRRGGSLNFLPASLCRSDESGACACSIGHGLPLTVTVVLVRSFWLQTVPVGGLAGFAHQVTVFGVVALSVAVPVAVLVSGLQLVDGLVQVT